MGSAEGPRAPPGAQQGPAPSAVASTVPPCCLGARPRQCLWQLGGAQGASGSGPSASRGRWRVQPRELAAAAGAAGTMIRRRGMFRVRVKVRAWVRDGFRVRLG